jgi:sensor domain CHASE-containing protein
MVLVLTVYFALSLLAALVVFAALILGSRTDRLDDAAVRQLFERQPNAA